MFEWKVEDMALLNQKGGTIINDELIYNCEYKTTREDKIDFVDSMQSGKLSYLLNLAEKFEKEKSDLPVDKYGDIKTVSFKAWIKRNDTRGAVDNSTYRRGCINLFMNRKIQNINQKGPYDVYSDYIDECFHRQLNNCKREEKAYFLAHDEYSILKQKLREQNYHTTFGVNIVFVSNGDILIKDKDKDLTREITIDELKYLLDKYAEVDALIDKITKETHIVY